MIQQIARTRDIKKLYFYFDKKKFKEPITNDFNEHKKYIERKNKDSEIIIKGKEDKYLNILYIDLLCDYEYNIMAYKSNMRAHFINLLISRGFNVKINNNINEVDKIERQNIIKEIKNDKLDNFEYDENNINYKNRKDILNIPNGKENEYKNFILCDNAFYSALNYRHLQYNIKDLEKEINKKERALI